MKYIIIFLLASVSIFSQVLVPQKTELNFVIDTRFGAAKGKFSNIAFSILDFQNKKARLEIDVNTIDTGNSLRDKHLRSDDFFDTANHPKAVFEVYSIKENGNVLMLSGKLTIKSIEKGLEFPVTMKDSPEAVQYTGEVELKRSEFGITYNSVLNPISDKVKITFQTNFEKKGK